MFPQPKRGIGRYALPVIAFIFLLKDPAAAATLTQKGGTLLMQAADALSIFIGSF